MLLMYYLFQFLNQLHTYLNKNEKKKIVHTYIFIYNIMFKDFMTDELISMTQRVTVPT